MTDFGRVQPRDLPTESTTSDTSSDVTGQHSTTTLQQLDVTNNSTNNSTSPSLQRLQHRVTTNNLALLELADLRQRQAELISDVRNTFRQRGTSGVRKTHDRNTSNGEELCPGNCVSSESSTTSNGEELCPGNSSESSTSSDECFPSSESQTNNSFRSRTLSRLSDDHYRLPVCVSGLTACYPSPLHAILAQYSRVTLTSSTSTDSSYDKLAAVHCEMPELDLCTEVCNDPSHSEPETKSAGVNSLLQSTSTISVEQRGWLDRRLINITRSASTASVSSSEGYCSGTESESLVDVSFPESIGSGHDLSDAETLSQQSIGDDHVTTTVAVTRLLSTLIVDKSSGATWRVTTNKERKPKRRLCKTNRRLSPLASTDEDEVFVTISSFNKFKTTRLAVDHVM